MLLGLADVEANYAVVKAYQYTTLTSIQVKGFLLQPHRNNSNKQSYTDVKLKNLCVKHTSVCYCCVTN